MEQLQAELEREKMAMQEEQAQHEVYIIPLAIADCCVKMFCRSKWLSLFKKKKLEG